MTTKYAYRHLRKSKVGNTRGNPVRSEIKTTSFYWLMNWELKLTETPSVRWWSALAWDGGWWLLRSTKKTSKPYWTLPTVLNTMVPAGGIIIVECMRIWGRSVGV